MRAERALHFSPLLSLLSTSEGVLSLSLSLLLSLSLSLSFARAMV